MSRAAVITGLTAAMALALPAICAARVGANWYSQQTTPSQASAGASVQASSQSPGAPAVRTPASYSAESQLAAGPNASESSSSTSVGRLRGAGCPEINYGPPCIAPRTEGTRTAARAPAVNPAVVAQTAAARLSLSAGGIQASPSQQTNGLTGAASWLWLSPTTSTHSLSVALGGERVTVTATPQSVRWSFGDNSDLVAGPGVPYRPGAAPASAVRHVYQTRCLPGDQGHDPNVLSSCGPNGYTIEALVQWAISYAASGPVAGGGALPSRSTATSIVYPVSEARAFLTAGGGQ